MTQPGEIRLSGRERQIMEVIYAHGEATVSQIHEGLPDPPTRTAVRTLLRILEAKGVITHGKQGREFHLSLLPGAAARRPIGPEAATGHLFR